MVNDTKGKPKKIKEKKRNGKLTRAEKLANALKKNMKLRKEKK